MSRKRSQSSKNIEWYTRYKNALKYLGVDIKELKHPTAKHVASARSQWRSIKKEMYKKGWVDLPSVYEASRMVAEQPRVETSYSDYLETYLPQLIAHIQSKDYEEIQRYQSGRNAVASLNDAKNDLIDKLTWARAKIQDDEALAKAISKSPFVERALNTIEYYTRTSVGRDALTYMEDVVAPVLEQAINDVIREM